jgi:hypothetical protein
MAALVVTVTVAVLLLNPWRRSNESVRARLFAITPRGSRLEDVRSILDQRGWHEPALQQTWPLPARQPFLGGTVGSYQGLPWYTTVRAFWEFDERGGLKDIKIDRIMDSP